jgi:hypothetical protein
MYGLQGAGLYLNESNSLLCEDCHHREGRAKRHLGQDIQLHELSRRRIH